MSEQTQNPKNPAADGLSKLQQLREKLESIRLDGVKDVAAAANSKDLYEVKVRWTGKNGALSLLMREMKDLTAEERPEFGKFVNAVKDGFEEAYKARETELKSGELRAKLQAEALDLTLPGPERARGHRHPVQAVTQEIVQIFSRLGFSVRQGPLIELDHYNFEALNIPADHPARDMQDTFYIDDKHVLRTQTSPIQIHSLEKEQLPLRVLGPGSVFRNDYDVTHLPMFHQVEGMLVDRKVSMAELKGALTFFCRELFGSSVKTRFRPSFFPFTEPSAELDSSCPSCGGKGCRVCKGTGWLEMGGCGLVHPNVFKLSKIDPREWQGYAFGVGVERLAMVKYGIEDIRLLVENDVRFLRQFPS